MVFSLNFKPEIVGSYFKVNRCEEFQTVRCGADPIFELNPFAFTVRNRQLNLVTTSNKRTP